MNIIGVLLFCLIYGRLMFDESVVNCRLGFVSMDGLICMFMVERFKGVLI